MPPRLPIASSSVRTRPFVRHYAVPETPPPPFTTSVKDSTSSPIPPSHDGTTSPSSPSSTFPVGQRKSNRPAERAYPDRKQFLNLYYDQMIRKSPLFLLFEHDNLTVQDWNAVRSAINRIPAPSPDSVNSSTPAAEAKAENPSGKRKKSKKEKADAQPTILDTSAGLTVIRTGVFAAIARNHKDSARLVPWLTGQRAALHSQHLSPPYLKQVIAATNKALKSRKRDGDVKQPSMKLVVGLVDGRLVPAKQVEEIADLPDLATLRGQLVGSLESPGRSILGLLGQAGGGGLVRTLQGLEQSLKEKEGGDAPAA